MKKFQLFFLARQMGFVLCGLGIGTAAFAETGAPTLSYEVIATLSHDVNDFTQGLLVHRGELIESTGVRGRSALIRKKLDDGSVLQRQELPREHFGEGIAIAGDRLFQLTWTAGVAWVYDLSLRRTGQFRYSGQGWGLAYDGTRLLMSDGSARIRFRDPGTFDVTGTFDVHDGGRPVRGLNELEYARGLLHANVWQDDRVAAIDTSSGQVAAWYNLSRLKKGFVKPPGWNPAEHVLNGIAWDPQQDLFYVTGKCWPVMYKLRLQQPRRQAGSATPQ